MAKGDFAVVNFLPPVLEFAGEQLGKVVLESGLSRVAKLLPLPEALRRLTRETKRDTDQDTKYDATHVIKVADAVAIVREEWTKLNEAGDLAGILGLPSPSGKPIQTPLERTILRFRQDALRQDTPRKTVEKSVYTRKP